MMASNQFRGLNFTSVVDYNGLFLNLFLKMKGIINDY